MGCRFGGEEFLILHSNTSRDAAALVGERLRNAAQTQDYFAAGTRIELTVSLGCATLLPGESSESLLRRADRSEEHTSELQSLMRISYAVFCLKKKKKYKTQHSKQPTIYTLRL